MRDKSIGNFNKFVFNQNLLKWYEENKRLLPWRETNDPYAIWVSEIMLQQTKVDTVIDYYRRFLTKYPTVFHLAEAKEQEVLKEWEGLGYYSRARNLHTAAKEVVEKYDGKIPQNPEILGKLKGIGPYTKGAISSIAFGIPVPAVDGNVMRVLSRVLLIEDNVSDQKTRKRFEEIVREIIDKDNPSAFNQALMEIGALICTPTSPACLHCPVQEQCRAFAVGKENELPIKLKKKKQKKIAYDVFVIYDEEGKIAVEKRPETGLLANMWQFPMVESIAHKNKKMLEDVRSHYGIDIHIEEELGKVKHIFSHLIWDLTVWKATCLKKYEPKSHTFLTQDELTELPFSVSHIKIKEMIYVPLNTK